MKVFTQEYQDIQCFTDFDPDSADCMIEFRLFT